MLRSVPGGIKTNRHFSPRVNFMGPSVDIVLSPHQDTWAFGCTPAPARVSRVLAQRRQHFSFRLLT